MARHFHTNPLPRLAGLGGLNAVFPDFELARAAGINIFGPVGGGGIADHRDRASEPRQNHGTALIARQCSPTPNPE